MAKKGNKVKFYHVHWNGYGLDRSWEWKISEGRLFTIPGIDFSFAAKRDQYEKGWEVINLETGYQVGSGTTLKNAVELVTADLQKRGNGVMEKAVASARAKGFIPPPVPTSEDCASL
jgi:hypothetical protein